MIFVKHLSQWSIPTVLETISKSCVILICANLLSKTDFGILTLVMFIYSFHGFLHFGILDGLILKLPDYYIKRDTKKIISSLSLSLSYILLILTFIIILSFLYISLSTPDKTQILCFIFFLTAVPYQFYSHYLLLNRYTYRFEVTLRARLLVVLMRLCMQVPAIYLFRLEGVIVAEILIYIISALYIKLKTQNSLNLY